jgi:hypothetical protein
MARLVIRSSAGGLACFHSEFRMCTKRQTKSEEHTSKDRPLGRRDTKGTQWLHFRCAENAHLTETHRPIRADPGDPMDKRFRTKLGVLAFYLAFSFSYYFFPLPTFFNYTSISL